MARPLAPPPWGYSCDFEDRPLDVSLNGLPVESNVYDGSGDGVMATANESSVVNACDRIATLCQKNVTYGGLGVTPCPRREAYDVPPYPYPSHLRLNHIEKMPRWITW